MGDVPSCDSIGQEAKVTIIDLSRCISTSLCDRSFVSLQDALQRLFCMGCDPDQLSYTLFTSLTAWGFHILVPIKFMFGFNTCCANTDNTMVQLRVRVCSEFATKLDLKLLDRKSTRLISNH